MNRLFFNRGDGAISVTRAFVFGWSGPHTSPWSLRIHVLRTINGGVRTKQEAGKAQGDRLLGPFLGCGRSIISPPGNRMSRWHCAKLRMRASPAHNQESRSQCAASVSLPLPLAHPLSSSPVPQHLLSFFRPSSALSVPLMSSI